LREGTYSFLFYSGETKNEESDFTKETAAFANLTPEHSLELFNSSNLPLSEPERKARSKGFTPTSQAVCHVIFQLPFHRFQFNIYMDNYFSSIPLFQHLRDHGIGAAGTTRPGRHDFPAELALDKSVARRILEWNHLSGTLVNGVWSALWQDNNTVLFLTTIHDLRQLVLANRLRPKKCSTNAISARKPFGEFEYRKLLPIPEMIDDYNQFMGGVDIADQLRSNYPTHQKSQRTWLPLWFWALDTTVSNCYVINKHLTPDQSHKEFRLLLARSLIQEGWSIGNPLLMPRVPHYRSHVTKHTTLSPFHLRN